MPARVGDAGPIEGTQEDYRPVITSPAAHAIDIQSLRCQEEVVISGLSGRLPESDNIEEFRQHLVNKDDMVTEDDRRWPPGIHGLPTRSGKLKDLSKFDASYFGVHPKQAHSMDPQLRMLLEVTYEALADAGVNCQAVRGSRTGVFIGCSASESHEAWSNDPEKIVGYEMTGCTRSMFANRLSYFFDFKGPSYATDTACSSSLLALDQAMNSIRSGQCDAAIVGGCSLCLKPSTSLQFQKLGMLSPDGACKSFDASGNGYCRSEAVVAIYLQKKSEAKRNYATVVHSKTNSDGNKEQGITFPSGGVQKQLLTEVYREAGVDPSQVAYVEAHGTGTKAGDPQELNSIAEIFCGKGRDGALLIGSTKSNMGHPEPASGLAAVSKVLIAMEDGVIPSNLHFNSPNPDIPALADGRLQVVSDHTPWQGGYVGINSFGFGGSNVHVLLKSNKKPSIETPHVSCNEKRLFTYSGRTQEAVEHALNQMAANSGDMGLQKLLEENAKAPGSSHLYRGHIILNHDVATPQVQKVVSDGRPVWFVFAGMGTQWNGMGRDLMNLDAFKTSIMKSDAILRQHNLHLYDILMSGDDATFNNTLNSFVCIAAIQVALVDVLKTVGIQPDGIVGHSVGELGCAYADGGLTAEEAVLAAYWRGQCVLEANLPPGGMAAVGMTWEEAAARCPDGVVPACHNSIDTVTISGPQEAVSQFVKVLQSEGIFAKEVKSAGVAFHSYFMAKTAPSLKAALQKVIVRSRPRTKRWISSSIPESQWDSELARFSSADYHVNNLVSPVLFQEALQHVPENAITIEIAPHCLLQAILKRSLPVGCSFTGLMKRNYPDNLEFLLSSLGKLYAEGVNFSPLALYPAVPYPVPQGTKMVSPMLKWDHSQVWEVPHLEQFAVGGGSGSQSSQVFEVDPSEESDDHYLRGHMIDGRVLFPATGYLVLAWRTLAKMSSQMYEQMPVAFENVHIHRATILPPTGTMKFEVNITPGTGHFEVSDNGTLLVSGRIYEPTQPILRIPVYSNPGASESPDLIPLTMSDIYKELRLRGYNYGPTFQGILSASNTGEEGHLMWNGKWVSFIDTMLQIKVLSLPGRSLRLPTRIKSLRIDPTAHQEKMIQIDSCRQAVKVSSDALLDTCVAGGVELLGIHAAVAPRRQQTHTAPSLEQYVFLPHCSSPPPNPLLMAYREACDHYVASQEKTEMINKSVAMTKKSAEFEQFPSEKFPLLSVLKESSVGGNDDLDGSVCDKLSGDPLLHAIRQDHLLKPCIDLVIENSASALPIVKVVEYSEMGPISDMYADIIPQFNTHPMLEVNYTMTGAKVESMDTETLTQYGVSTAIWDLASDTFPNQAVNADLLVMSNVLWKQHNPEASMAKLKAAVREGGFILIQESTCHSAIPYSLNNNHHTLPDALPDRSHGPFFVQETLLDLLTTCGLDITAVKNDSLLHTLVLCRVPSEQHGDDDVFISVDSASYEWVEEVQTALSSGGGRIWLLAESCPHNGVVGMVNCLRQEDDGKRIRCLFLSNLQPNSEAISFKDSSLFSSIAKHDLAMNVCRDGQWGSFRYLPSLHKPQTASIKTQHAYVNVLTRGDLASLRWIESPLKHHASSHMNTRQLCHVYYTSLNFRDIMLATGKLPPDAIPGNLASQDCILGMEFSGRDEEGQRIMGLLPAKALATTVDADRQFLWSVPDSWCLEEAATVPVVYTTAYYALVVRGRIKKGDKVLIHSGSGGVGQAAIAIALHEGCEVFTTVGSAQKRDFLKEQFPQLTDRNFANSRDETFEWDILRATRGKGVDVILNSLAEEKLQASVRILAQHGRFLEIGKVDLSNDSALGMGVFLKNITFHGILLDALFNGENDDWTEVSRLLSKGVKEGVVKPLKRSVFDKYQVEDAFRFMAQGKHIGKVLIKIRDEEEGRSVQPPTAVDISAIPRSCCHPNKSYIIVGGLGGFGVELVHWLVERGARHLIVTSRSGVKTGYQSRCLRVLREAGVNIQVSTHNVARHEGAEAVLTAAAQMAPVGGIFNLAMVLRDGLLENQTVDNFCQVANPKVCGTQQLDCLSRKLCSGSLDWFVVFSSVSCGRGNAGQSNYGFANSVMERICEQRQHDNLPGLAIQWGAIGDVGVILDTMGGNDTVVAGSLPQRITSCLGTLDFFLNQQSPIVSSLVLAEKQSTGAKQGNEANLVDSVAHILGIKDSSCVNPDMTLGDLGLDSLMGVEVKQTLERDHNLSLPMRDIRLLTINKLKNIGGSPKKTDGNQKVPSKHFDVLNESGVSMRYEQDQLVPSVPVLKMNSKEEGDSGNLFVVHPIEGSVVSLNMVMEKVMCSIYGLQCTQDVPLTSIPDLAQFYIKQIKSVQPEGPYRLAGYSFGACVAFEAALQLKTAGEKVDSLILLDGSHSYVAAHIAKHKERLKTDPSPAVFESESLCAFTLQFIDTDYTKLSTELMAMENFESRVSHVVNIITKASAYTNVTEVTRAAEAFYHKLVIADKYVPSVKLSGCRVKLVKASQGYEQSQPQGQDFGLDAVVEGEVDVSVVDGDHQTFIHGSSASQVSDVINGWI